MRGERDQAAAGEALARYLTNKDVAPTPSGPQTRPTLATLLALYAEDCAGKVAAPKTLAYSIQALVGFWGELHVEDVSAATCRAYAAMRAKPRALADGRQVRAGSDTVRRELGVLQAALNFALRERVVPQVYPVSLPRAAAPRDRWLERHEAAAILKEAAPHLRRFIVLSLYTGRREAAVLALKWRKGPGGGWIDVARGLIDFEDPSRARTKKARGSAALPRRLWAHARRWQALGETGPIRWRGAPVQRIDVAFDAACRRAQEHNRALDLSDVSVHTLKHTAITWAFQAGMSLEDATDYFATSAATLMGVYRQHSPLYQRRAVSVMDRLGSSQNSRNKRA